MYAILLSFLLIAIKGSTAERPRFPNIGYLGSGYNIYKGNPHSTRGLDPGFTFNNLYKFTYDNGQTTADGRYSIPDGTHADKSPVCSFEFFSESIQNAGAYHESLRREISAGFGGWGASFSASSDYNEVYENSFSASTIYMESSIVCEAYTANAGENVNRFSEAFQEDVKHLSPDATNPEREARIFFDRWGTHVVYRMRTGGRYGIKSSFSSGAYSQMYATGKDIETSAGYSGIFSLNNNVLNSEQRQQAEEFEGFRSDLLIYQIGGKPPLIDDDFSTFEWTESVHENPLPLKYDLHEVTSALTSANFPDDEKIDEKREFLEHHVTGSYCLSLEIVDIEMCKVDFDVDKLIQVRLVDKYKKLDCVTEYGDFHYYHDITASNQYILGTVVNLLNKEVDMVPTIVVQRSDTDLIAQNTHWTMYPDPGGRNIAALQATCPSGYTDISFFQCCSNKDIESCLLTIPRTLPCVANKCVTKCMENYEEEATWESRARSLGFGNPQLGNAYHGSAPHFWNYKSANNQHFRCLDTSCLNFVSAALK